MSPETVSQAGGSEAIQEPCRILLAQPERGRGRYRAHPHAGGRRQGFL